MDPVRAGAQRHSKAAVPPATEVEQTAPVHAPAANEAAPSYSGALESTAPLEPNPAGPLAIVAPVDPTAPAISPTVPGSLAAPGPALPPPFDPRGAARPRGAKRRAAMKIAFGVAGVAAVFGVVLVGIGTLGGAGLYYNYFLERGKVDRPIYVSLPSLEAAYTRDETTAHEQYGGKWIRTWGTIVDTKKGEFLDEFWLGNGPTRSLQCEYMSERYEISPGDRVTIKGYLHTYEDGLLRLSTCSIVDP